MFFISVVRVRLPSPRYKLPDLRQGGCTVYNRELWPIGNLGLSGTWVYRGFCYQGKGNRGTRSCRGVGIRYPCTIGAFGLSGTWVYLWFCYWGNVIGDLDLSGSWD